jgi:hypothetical protein
MTPQEISNNTKYQAALARADAKGIVILARVANKDGSFAGCLVQGEHAQYHVTNEANTLHCDCIAGQRNQYCCHRAVVTRAEMERAAQAAQECTDCGKRYHTLATHECYGCHTPLCAECYERNGELCCTCSANVDLYDDADALRDAAYEARIYREEREEYQRLDYERELADSEAELNELATSHLDARHDYEEPPMMLYPSQAQRLFRGPASPVLPERVKEAW